MAHVLLQSTDTFVNVGIRLHGTRSSKDDLTSGSEPRSSTVSYIDTLSRAPAAILVVLLLISLPPRLISLNAPLTGEHEFRQTQTAMAVWEIREHGWDVLRPKLPIFGPPWECPMEYPVFHLAAAALDRVAPWTNLDLSIRVTNVVFFYLTAIAMYLLARQLFRGPGVALFSAAVFLFSPYNVFWSKASMIEYAATFFALFYLLLFLRWTRKPVPILFALCLCSGLLGCLTKITTFGVVFFIAASLFALHGLAFMRQSFRLHKAKAGFQPGMARQPQEAPRLASTVAVSFQQVILMACLLVLPVLAGWGYTKYGDKIKEQSPYTAWLSSAHPYMKAWNYGTCSQRLNLANWGVIVRRARVVVMPSLSIALAVGLFCLPFRVRGFRRLSGGNFWMGCSLALAPLAAILLFFNLYWVHTYYFLACAPLLALLAGTALFMAFELIRKVYFKLLFVLLLVGLWLQDLSPRMAQELYWSGKSQRVGFLSEAAKLIAKDDPVIVFSRNDFNSFVPYYLKRRAFMAMFHDGRADIRPLLNTDYFKKNGFRWLLVEGGDSDTLKLAAEISGRWRIVRRVTVPYDGTDYALYSLSDEQVVAEPSRKRPFDPSGT